MTGPRILKVSDKDAKPRVVEEVDYSLLLPKPSEVKELPPGQGNPEPKSLPGSSQNQIQLEPGVPLGKDELMRRVGEDQRKRESGLGGLLDKARKLFGGK
jgi:hypothetical protein